MAWCQHPAKLAYLYLLPAVPQDLTLCSRGDDPLNLGLSLLLCQEHQPHPCCCLGRTAGGARRGRAATAAAAQGDSDSLVCFDDQYSLCTSYRPLPANVERAMRFFAVPWLNKPACASRVRLGSNAFEQHDANLSRNGCSKSCTHNPGLKRWLT